VAVQRYQSDLDRLLKHAEAPNPENFPETIDALRRLIVA